MANFWFDDVKRAVMAGEIDLTSDVIHVLLLRDTTNADVSADAVFVSDITVLNEFDGANYARKTLSNKTVTLAASVGTFDDTADITWTALGAGTDPVQSVLVIKFVTNDTDSPVLFHLDQGTNLPFTPNGGDVVNAWNGAGIATLT
jgi:hypothetical protein